MAENLVTVNLSFGIVVKTSPKRVIHCSHSTGDISLNSAIDAYNMIVYILYNILYINISIFYISIYIYIYIYNKISQKCSKGKIYRRSYKRNNTRVPGSCIKAQSDSGLKTTDIDKKIMSKKAQIHRQVNKLLGTPKCSSKQILRQGYKRTSKKGKSYMVPSTCITSKTGKPHGKQLFVIKSGILDKYGYYDIIHKTDLSRHRALSSAVKDIKPLSLYRRLNALALVNRNTNPDLARLFKSDAEWLKTRSEYINRA